MERQNIEIPFVSIQNPLVLLQKKKYLSLPIKENVERAKPTVDPIEKAKKYA